MMSDKIIKPAGMGGAPAVSFAPGKVVKSEVFDATLESRQIVEAARAEARTIIEEAERSRDAVIEAARQEGHQLGLLAWNEAVVEANAAFDRHLANSEPEMVRLAVRIAQKIIGEELRTRPETIIGVARECLQGLRRERTLTLRVTPSEVDFVRSRLSELRQAAGPDRSITVTGDSSVSPGGCIVESDYGVVDAHLETQLRCLEEILLRTTRK